MGLTLQQSWCSSVQPVGFAVFEDSIHLSCSNNETLHRDLAASVGFTDDSVHFSGVVSAISDLSARRCCCF